MKIPILTAVKSLFGREAADRVGRIFNIALIVLEIDLLSVEAGLSAEDLASLSGAVEIETKAFDDIAEELMDLSDGG